MRVIHLDGRNMTSRESLHTYLAGALDFPSWYGHNLDALYDLLCELGPVRLVLEQVPSPEHLSPYGRAVLDTFRDAAKSNPNLEVEYCFATPAPHPESS